MMIITRVIRLLPIHSLFYLYANDTKANCPSNLFKLRVLRPINSHFSHHMLIMATRATGDVLGPRS